MRLETLIIITLLSLVGAFTFFYALKLFFAISKKQKEEKKKESTQVGFVVDTFHRMVSQLKEKERELEILRRKAEDKASSIELYNENIFQSVPSGVVSFDEEFRITKVNAAAGKILDLKEPGVIGKQHSEVLGSPIREMIETRKIVERAEISYSTPSGKRIWLGLTISPLKDHEEKRIGQILIFTDLTELKAFQSQMELRERLSTLGEMSAGIAHELRNPMGVISGYTKILLKKADVSLTPAIEAIAREVSVMDRIIADFLSFARSAEIIPSDIDLGTLVKSCIQSLEGRLSGISMVLDVDHLPGIKADEVMLRQAVTNLIQNALEAMPDGGELRITGSAGRDVALSFSDSGYGIPENIRDKIFLPFYTTKERGTGLGLSIVHKIVVSHGGSVHVDSSDRGTTFTIRMPLELVLPSRGR